MFLDKLLCRTQFFRETKLKIRLFQSKFCRNTEFPSTSDLYLLTKLLVAKVHNWHGYRLKFIKLFPSCNTFFTIFAQIIAQIIFCCLLLKNGGSEYLFFLLRENWLKQLENYECDFPSQCKLWIHVNQKCKFISAYTFAHSYKSISFLLEFAYLNTCQVLFYMSINFYFIYPVKTSFTNTIMKTNNCKK